MSSITKLLSSGNEEDTLIASILFLNKYREKVRDYAFPIHPNLYSIGYEIIETLLDEKLHLSLIDKVCLTFDYTKEELYGEG